MDNLTPAERRMVQELLNTQRTGGHSDDVYDARQAGELTEPAYEYKALYEEVPSVWTRITRWFRSMLGLKSGTR